MSIARRQIDHAVNSIIKKSLQNGRFPSVTEVIQELNDHFSDKVLGQPTMKIRTAKSRKPGSSQDWNATVDEIYEDLDTVYEETLDQVNRVLVDFDYAETERNNIYVQLSKLEDQINNLLLLNDNLDGYLYSAYDTFKDLSKVDMDETTAFVDLELGEAVPKPTKAGTDKVDLSRATVRREVVQGNVVSQEVISGFNNCLDDNIDSAWIERVKVKQLGDVSYQITLGLDDEDVKNVTKLNISVHDSRRVLIDVSITEDGFNWSNLQRKTAEDVTSWSFPEISVKGLRITLIRRESDPTTIDDGYYYTFGLKNISLIKMGYEDSGILTSKPHHITNRQGKDVNLSRLSLEVEEEVPTGTELRYYLAIDTGGDPDWQPISPISHTAPRYPKTIDLKSIGTGTPVTMLSSGVSRYPDSNTYYNGLAFFSLGSLSHNNVIKNSAILYKGINQWKQEVYTYEWLEDVHIPTINDWINLPIDKDREIEITPSNISTQFLDMDFIKVTPTNTEALDANVAHGNFRWSTSLFCEIPKKVTGKLSLGNTGNSGYVVVYVNNSEVKREKLALGGSTNITYNLLSGWNTIQILFYNDGVTDTTVYPGIRPNQHAQKLRGEINRMTQVDTFDLYYNVREAETGYYAIEDNEVIINDATRAQGARFEISYRYYLTQNNNNVLFKAEFEKPKSVVTPPRLKSYKIRAID